MPTINDKLLSEKSKSQTSVILYKEGVFYVAYEHSAWLFHRVLHPFKPKKRFVKCVAMDIVSLGFPATLLESKAAGRQYHVDGAVACIELAVNEVPDVCDFEDWKNEVQCDKVASVDSDVSQSVNDDAMIMDEIRSFPIESKTPIECMLFLTQIKKKIK